ncbi:MAG TPA: HAMP domain-containing sensor histidine kinase [Dermatophilaceae bacterium]|nr:HAMP domain-containing sensor histidine kinase [Dermatophilaceae bacterium]
MSAPARARRFRSTLEGLPLRVRLVAVLLALLLLALTLTAAATTLLMRRDLVGSVDRELRTAATPVATMGLQRVLSGSQDPLPTRYAFVLLPVDGSDPVTVNPVGESEHPAVPPLPLDSGHVQTREPFTIGSTDGNLRWRAVAGRLTDGSATYAVAAPLRTVERTTQRLVVIEVLLGATVLIAMGLLGWYAVNRTFRPLHRIEDTATAIAAGDLTRRVPVPEGRDEVASLARSLNAMLARIEQSFAVREASEERMRQFVADASHELRTPLAAVRGYAELYRQGAVRDPEGVGSAMDRIESEATRMGGLVEDLLLLARVEERRATTFSPVDLTVLAVDAAQDARAVDPSRSITVRGHAGAALGPTVVEGDEPRLRQVLANLVGNVVRHTPAGTPVELGVGRRGPQGPAVVEVIDHGPGVDPALAEQVFERFFRTDPSRTRAAGGGNGLGLAIAAAIVTAHHGKIGVGPTPGGGATFVVELPTAATQQEPSED